MDSATPWPHNWGWSSAHSSEPLLEALLQACIAGLMYCTLPFFITCELSSWRRLILFLYPHYLNTRAFPSCIPCPDSLTPPPFTPRITRSPRRKRNRRLYSCGQPSQYASWVLQRIFRPFPTKYCGQYHMHLLPHSRHNTLPHIRGFSYPRRLHFGIRDNPPLIFKTEECGYALTRFVDEREASSAPYHQPDLTHRT